MENDFEEDDFKYLYDIIKDICKSDLKKEYRQQSINRWLDKRKRRKFLKTKKSTYTYKSKYNGNIRNNKTGRFTKKLNKFIPITEFMKLNKN
jgi:hypothetical protein